MAIKVNKSALQGPKIDEGMVLPIKTIVPSSAAKLATGAPIELKEPALILDTNGQELTTAQFEQIGAALQPFTKAVKNAAEAAMTLSATIKTPVSSSLDIWDTGDKCVFVEINKNVPKKQYQVLFGFAKETHLYFNINYDDLKSIKHSSDFPALIDQYVSDALQPIREQIVALILGNTNIH